MIAIAIVIFSLSSDSDSIMKTNILTLFETNKYIDKHIQDLNIIDLLFNIQNYFVEQL